jgi:hypothetical protein
MLGEEEALQLTEDKGGAASIPSESDEQAARSELERRSLAATMWAR